MLYDHHIELSEDEQKWVIVILFAGAIHYMTIAMSIIAPWLAFNHALIERLAK